MARFVRLMLNGVEVPKTNYTVTAGSTIITLNEEYLKTLADGTYNFRAEFSNNDYAILRLVVSNNFGRVPQTGVSITGTLIAMCLSVLITVSLGIYLVNHLKEKRKKRSFGSHHGK